MIYIFDKKQAIIKVLTNDDFTAAHLNFKINTATTFEFSLPASKALPIGSKYVATPHPLNNSKFIMLRLTERVDNTETIDYSAYELAYQELATDGYIEDKRPQNQSALNLMKIALNGSNWELNNVNVSGTATTNFYYVDRLSAISKVVDLLGGEIVFYIEIQGNAISGRYMDYLARQGADTSKVFASGSNLLTVERQSDTSGIYTAILPRGKGEEIDNGKADTPDGYGRRINIADVEWKKSAGSPLDKPKGSIVLSDPDATAEWGQINGNARLLLQTYDDIDDVNVLINSAYKTLQSVNHPQIQYSATVADVGGLSLGDTVLIMHGDRDLSYKTRVFEVKHDLLSPDQTELSLGDDLSSNSITSQLNSLSTVADTTSSQTQWTINQIGRPSTTFGNTEPANPKVGDVFFKELPDGGTEIHRWNGNIWELLASPTTADDIATAVTDAVAQAKSHTDEVKQVLSSDIETAKSQAASLANTAEANAKSEATSLFSRAQSALSDAKTDLTKSIASEASKAVAAANSQAQNYVDQAKSDINDTINALTVGGRNLLLGTSSIDFASNIGANGSANIELLKYDNNINMLHITAPINTGQYVGIFFPQNNSTKIQNGEKWSFSFDIKGVGDFTEVGIEGPGTWVHSSEIGEDWSRISSTNTASTRTNLVMFFDTSNKSLDVYVKLIKLETGTIPTDWTPAPEDIVLDYTTKDNEIKETITQYKETNDGHVSKLQTDVTKALGEVTTKISKTEYDQKTGELSKTINDTKDTADRSAQSIADIQEADGRQDSRISEVEKTAGEIKSTVSDISTEQGKQSGYISTLKQRADGFDATVTKVNNLSVGGRNLLTGTRSFTFSGNIGTNASTIDMADFDSDTKMLHLTAPQGSGGYAGLFMGNELLKANNIYSFSFDIKGTGMPSSLFGWGDYSSDRTQKGSITSDWSRMSILGTVTKDNSTILLYFNTDNQPLDVYIKLWKIETGNTPTDWTPAPEDLSSATAKAQLTADEASAAVTKLTNADGIITKVQADIKANADAISEKVSKTVYDQKNGELSRTINEAKDTADESLRTIGDYKTSNDERVKAAESSIERTAKAITEKVSQTDYDNDKSTLNERFTKVEKTADGASTTVGKLLTTVNNLGQINQLFNTEFSPDFAGWYAGNSATSGSYVQSHTLGASDGWSMSSEKYNGSNVINFAVGKTASFYSDLIPAGAGTPVSVSMSAKSSSDYTGSVTLAFYIRYYDANKNYISQQAFNSSKATSWTKFTLTDTTPTNTAYVVFNILTNGSAGINSYSQPMLVFASTVGAYVQGNYNNNAALAQVKITADGINNFVRDSSGNISSDFQTALSKTSIITGSTLATSIQKQTATQISSAITDNNGKIISLINQDSSGVQIAGKNIVLDGNTTVTGTFKVSQANIANGAIGTAQIGDAAITSAKIANLDVSKITGNVSNFIQSNWNGVYESTTITNNGMQIATSDITTSFGPRGIKLTQGGESVGGIGVSSYVDMPTDFQGIAFNLDGTGDYMTWSARDSGVTTGDYTTKLAWFRSSYKPIGQNAGFNFSQDSPVTFWGNIYGRENTEPLKIASFGMHGVSAGGIGHGNGSSAITFGGDGEIYIVSGGQYYKLAQFVKALQPLIGLGTWSAPKNINSSGTVTQWTNITT